MCPFHQKKIVQRYLTMRSKLEANKDLKKIVSRLTQTTEKNFAQRLDASQGHFLPSVRAMV